MHDSQLDAFICVHERDLGYLFEVALQSYFINFVPKGTLMLISNDRRRLAEFVEQVGVQQRVTVSSDGDWLSRQERELPGWYRQQVIKLRAYEFCQSPNFCNIGADTVLLRRIERSDLVADSFPILYYRRHRPPTIHLGYEWMRLWHIARILQVKPANAWRYVDFINDLFCFNREALIGLNRHLEKLYGSQPYYRLLRDFGTDKKNNKKFGEWTLYSVYLLDCLKQRVTLKNSAAGFSHQVHGPRYLSKYRFDSKVVHFVDKAFDVDQIKWQIVNRGLELGQYLMG